MTMSELEKLEAGLEYCYDDSEVDARKQQAILWNQEYNRLDSTDEIGQQACLKKHLKELKID